MSFDRPWVLLLTLLPLAWAAVEWRRSDRRIALVLKALSFVLVLLALAEPTITVPETRSAVALLVDTSASLAPEAARQNVNLADEVWEAVRSAREEHARKFGNWSSLAAHVTAFRSVVESVRVH